jgi:hypothetical protein
VRELVAYDAEAPAGTRLRIWDRVEDDLVERAIESERSPCRTLGLHWVVAPIGDDPAALRLARDAAGDDLLLTAEEARAEEARARAESDAKLAEARAEIARLKALSKT